MKIWQSIVSALLSGFVQVVNKGAFLLGSLIGLWWVAPYAVGFLAGFLISPLLKGWHQGINRVRKFDKVSPWYRPIE